MNKKLLTTLAFFLTSLSLSAQYIVDKIKFEGSEHLNTEYLIAILTNKEGDLLEYSKIQKDIQALNSLSGVLASNYSADTIDNRIQLTFTIEKRGTVLPIFGIGGNKNNFWWNVGLSEYNLNGKNQKLEVYYLNNDRRHNGKVFFQNDRIKNGTWGYSLDFNRLASLEPLYFRTATVNFDYKNHAIGGSVLKWFGNNTLLTGGGNFFREDYNKNENSSNETPGPNQLSQNKLLLKVGLEKFNIHYDYFQRSGNTWSLNFQNVKTFGSPGSFNSLTFEGKQYYRPSNKINLAFRLKAAIATNNDSPFAPFVLDSNFNIRGVGNRVDRGTAQVVLNSEFRYALYHQSHWAFQAVAFADAGSWRSPGEPLSNIWNLREVILYSGVGARIIYKKQFETIIRIDYGFDAFDKKRNGVVVGVGQYF